jgi:inorganic triphosphatase YgiF
VTNATVKVSNAAPLQAAGILQLGQFSSAQQLLTAWQQQLAPACRAAWGALRSDTQAFLQLHLAADSQHSQQEQQQQQLTWSAGNFLLELDALLGELQEVRTTACRMYSLHLRNPRGNCSNHPANAVMRGLVYTHRHCIARHLLPLQTPETAPV